MKLSFTLKVLHRAFVLFRCFPRIESAVVFPLAGLRIYFARIEDDIYPTSTF